MTPKKSKSKHFAGIDDLIKSSRPSDSTKKIPKVVDKQPESMSHKIKQIGKSFTWRTRQPDDFDHAKKLTKIATDASTKAFASNKPEHHKIAAKHHSAAMDSYYHIGSTNTEKTVPKDHVHKESHHEYYANLHDNMAAGKKRLTYKEGAAQAHESSLHAAKVSAHTNKTNKKEDHKAAEAAHSHAYIDHANLTHDDQTPKDEIAHHTQLADGHSQHSSYHFRKQANYTQLAKSADEKTKWASDKSAIANKTDTHHDHDVAAWSHNFAANHHHDLTTHEMTPIHKKEYHSKLANKHRNDENHHRSMTESTETNRGITIIEDTDFLAQDVIDMINRIGSGDHSDAVVNFNNLMDDKINSKLNDRTRELAAQIFGPSSVEEGRAPHDKKAWVPKEEKKKGDKNFKEDVDYLDEADITAIAHKMINAIVEKTGEPIDNELFTELFDAFLDEEVIYEGGGVWHWKAQKGFSTRGVELDHVAKSRKENEKRDANRSPKAKHDDAHAKWSEHIQKPYDERWGSNIDQARRKDFMGSRSDNPKEPVFTPNSRRLAKTTRRLKPSSIIRPKQPAPKIQDKNED